MATADLAQDCRDVLNSAGIPVVDVETIYPAPERHSLVENDHRFRDTWTKLRVFELVHFDVSRKVNCATRR
jgi:alpha-N-acetylglucosamine transferase